LSIDAVTRDVPPGRTLRHARAQDLGCLAVGGSDPRRVHTQRRRPSPAVAEPSSHGAQVDTCGQELRGRVVAQRVDVGVDLEAPGEVAVAARIVRSM
jgi:hypothetical protein